MTIYMMSEEDEQAAINRMIEEIDQMAAGKQLEALIAEKVMGWRLIPEEHRSWVRMAWAQLNGPQHADAVETMIVIPHDDDHWHYGQPSWFSTDDRTAMEVLRLFHQWEIRKTGQTGKEYIVILEPYRGDDGKAGGVGQADTLALAICRAALKAKLALNKRGEK